MESGGSKSDVGDSDGDGEGALHGPRSFRSGLVARLAWLRVSNTVLKRVSSAGVARLVPSPPTGFDFVL